MDTGLYISCEVNGLPKATFDVVDFTLEEALSSLYSLEVRLASFDANIDVDAQLLQPVKFTVLVDGVLQREINGIVAEIYRGDSGHHLTYYRILIRPTLWLMTLTQDNRIFHFKSIPDILDELLLKHHIQADKKLLDNHPQWEYTTQRNETDYDFFCRLAAEEGITFWFEEQQLFYSDSRIGMMGGPELSYNAHIQSVCREPVIHSLSYGAKMTPNSVHLKEYKFSHPSVALSSKDDRTKNRPQYTMYESYGRYEDDGVANQYSTYRLDAYLADSASGQAQSNCIILRPGKTLKITDHPTDAMNKSWQLVSIIHRGSLPQSVGNEAGDKTASLSNQFSFVPSNIDWRPPVRLKPTVFGDETATVVGPAGEEIYTNEYGEVKIHFHWNQYDPADDKASCWVRTGQGWNGNGFGIMAIPRIGQEVIIAYLNGDIDRPIIVGTVYNGKNDPPMRLPANKTQTTIRTKTHKGEGFNELRFEDAQGRQEVFIHAQKDMNTKVLNDRGTHVLHDHKENVDNDQTIVVGNNQSSTIGVDQTLDVGNDQTNTIGNNQTEKIGNHRDITVGNNDTLLVQSNQFETVAIAKTETIGAAKALTIGGAYQVTVGAAMNTSVALMQSEQVGQNKHILVNKNMEVEVGDTIKFTAGNVFEIVCGKSTIRLDQSGRVTILGTEFLFSASGPVQINGKDIDLN